MVTNARANATITREPQLVRLTGTTGIIIAATTLLTMSKTNRCPRAHLPKRHRARLAKGPLAATSQETRGLVHRIIALAISQAPT